MKKNAILLFIGMSILITHSCYFPSIKGSGVTEKKSIKVKDFKGIVLKGSGKVFLEQSDSFKVVVETDTNIIEHLTFEVKNNHLYLGKESIMLRPTKLNYYIALPSIEKLSIAGSGDIIAENKFDAPYLELNISGSGNISLYTQSKEVEASIAGSGDIKISGNTKDCSVSIAGSGDFNGKELKTNNCSISIAGSGNVYIESEQKLKVKIAGSGDVRYKGSPSEVNTNINGSGSLQKIK